MSRFIVLLLAGTFMLAEQSRGAFAAPGYLHKSVYVTAGGAGGGAVDGGGETALVVNKPVAVPVYKPVPVPIEVPVYKPVPVEVPVEVPVPVEKPVYVAQKPVYVAPKPVGGQGTAYGSVHFSSGNLFDNIFNIPISVLRSVNQFLNNNVRGSAAVQVYGQKNYGGYGAFVPAPAPALQYSGASSDSSSSSSAQSASQSAGSPGGSSSSSSAQSSASSSSEGAVAYSNKRPSFYNDVFNIPVSALTSVNTLLTGGK